MQLNGEVATQNENEEGLDDKPPQVYFGNTGAGRKLEIEDKFRLLLCDISIFFAQIAVD